MPRIIGEVYEQLIDRGRIAEDWLAPQSVQRLDRMDGDIDSLSARIAYVQNLDLPFQSLRLARPRQLLAGDHKGHRRQTVRRVA